MSGPVYGSRYAIACWVMTHKTVNLTCFRSRWRWPTPASTSRSAVHLACWLLHLRWPQDAGYWVRPQRRHRPTLVSHMMRLCSAQMRLARSVACSADLLASAAGRTMR